MLAAIAALAAAAGFSQGLTGFGFALVFTPLASVVLSPRQAVLAALLVGGVVSVLVLAETRGALPARRSWPLLLGAAIGAPCGVALLTLLDVTALRAAIAATALVLAAGFLLWRPRPMARERLALAAAGALGGFLNGSTSMGGPPAALTVACQRWEVRESRAALIAFNLLSYVVSLPLAAASGLLTPTSLVTGLTLLPFALGGTALGILAARRMSTIAFQRVLIGAVAVSAVISLAALLRPG